jgi:hypothetical protein
MQCIGFVVLIVMVSLLMIGILKNVPRPVGKTPFDDLRIQQVEKDADNRRLQKEAEEKQMKLEEEREEAVFRRDHLIKPYRDIAYIVMQQFAERMYGNRIKWTLSPEVELDVHNTARFSVRCNVDEINWTVKSYTISYYIYKYNAVGVAVSKFVSNTETKPTHRALVEGIKQVYREHVLG